MTLSQLEKKLTSLLLKKEKLIGQKNQVVAKQFEMENDVPEYSFSSKYNKLIERDFELADKIGDVERLIKNVRAQISKKQKDR